MRLAFALTLAIAWWLSGCTFNTRPPADPTTCKQSCARLAELKCDEGRPGCVLRCERARESLREIGEDLALGDVVAAESCEEARTRR